MRQCFRNNKSIMKGTSPALFAPQPVGRPPAKQRVILASLRADIISGRLPPGSRIPPRSELETRFQASPLTIQRAMDKLVADGFVRTEARGTYVTERPPHLRRFGLVFHSRPEDHANWRQFYSALTTAAQTRAAEENEEFTLYYGIDDRGTHSDFRRLVADVHASRLGGLILASNSPLLQRLLTHEPQVPAVSILVGEDASHPRFTAVTPDYESFFERACDYLLERQRRQIALIISPLQYQSVGGYFQAAITKRRLIVPLHHIQMPGLSEAAGAANAVSLLFHQSPAERPNGMIVADDNFLPFVVSGLLAEGVRVPADLELVTHANFPSPAARELPVTRLGFSATVLLERCVDYFKNRRENPTEPTIIKLPAMFAHELATTARERKPVVVAAG